MSFENLRIVFVIVGLGTGCWLVFRKIRDSRRIYISKVGGERHRGWLKVIDKDAPRPIYKFGPFKINVHGTECEIRRSPWIFEKTEKYLNEACTVCASCNKPIFPGMPVGKAWIDAPHPFTHLSMDCCDTGSLYCGMWGDGRLITLHELHPEKYPAGISTVMSAAFASSGKPVYQNIP
jgi:hypothetical protein